MAVLLLASGCGSDDPQDDAVASEPASTSSSAPPGLRLVVVGDSIPYNLSTDCSGCIGFIETYAAKVEEATGQRVDVVNLSEHTGLTVEGLTGEMGRLTDALGQADVIVVAIAHNSTELNSDRPCGVPLAADEMPRWSAVDSGCARHAAAAYRPKYARLFHDVAELRSGSPTILRTLNRYNDFIGWEEGHLSPAEDRRTKLVLNAWNAMLCDTAESAGFGCVDVYHAFNGPDGLQPSGDLLAEDYTHPSQKGNDVISDVLTEMGFEPLG
ncbi:SGNH/GDSL hydrolase family protein [Nocardioides sp. LHG3406-4]|uniref:SGNH/GDSL hydrolase family protein n=1 Tax=Nocardioides sp. LHG3406-4 TaxID=2804575 RepID=UPI003CEDACA6